MVDRGGLENRCSLYSGPWVRIPLSPHRAKVRNWGFCLFLFPGVRTEECQRRAREQGEQSLSLRTGQKLGIGAFAFFYCRGFEPRSGDPNSFSLHQRWLNFFAFCCLGEVILKWERYSRKFKRNNGFACRSRCQ